MPDPADNTELQQLLHDSTRAEHLLLQRASQDVHGSEQAALRKHAATQLIAHLRFSAEQLASEQGGHKLAEEASDTLYRPADFAIDAEQELLRSVFSQQVLAELCSILHNLYFRQAQLRNQASNDGATSRQQTTVRNQASSVPLVTEVLQPVSLHAVQPSAPQIQHAASAKLCSTAVQTEADMQASNELSHVRCVSAL